ncbi:phage tail protein [Acinetobacter chinensis]|uniref:Phage tail protein n=1 Tax=Acinetobacter chinensis TaxID=2004650 RepID=A0ABU3WIE7_9GAMM|nr:phage tail protein [Acinetobacter chinensis]MDV2469838.1 phage tail protein [Acinetobacter chinensis]
MKALIPLKSFLAEKLPEMSQDKCHLLIVNGNQSQGYMEYTVRILLLDYRGDPVEVLMLLRHWLQSKNLHLDAAKKDIQISFSSEIIDANTFDLEIDFAQHDKIVSGENGYHICPEMVWSDDHDKFVPVGTE